jgi:hypothetical protein
MKTPIEGAYHNRRIHMNLFVKDFLARNKVVIAYVRDVYGFRKGMVVALGPKTLGFSLVKKSEDVDYKRMKPHQLPTIQRMYHLGYPLEDIVESKAYQKCLNADGMIRVPRFNKDLAIYYAINSALSEEIKVEDDGTFIFDERVPADIDLWNVIEIVAERALKVKWEVK